MLLVCCLYKFNKIIFDFIDINNNLSTSNTQLIGGSWKTYENGQEFTISADVGTYYLWIYPIANENGVFNDNFVTDVNLYVLSTVKIMSCSSVPEYTYTGESEYIDDGNEIDIFVVGGGGGGYLGGGGGHGSYSGGAGGSGIVVIRNKR